MSTVGQDIINSMTEAVEHAQGGDVSVRETTVRVPKDVDVAAIRKRLGLSQDEFAIRFGFSRGTVRHWEQGRRYPDGAARAYLKVIDRDPNAVEKALLEA